MQKCKKVKKHESRLILVFLYEFPAIASNSTAVTKEYCTVLGNGGKFYYYNVPRYKIQFFRAVKISPE